MMRLLTTSLLLAAAPIFVQAADDTVLATVNGTPITAEKVSTYMKSLPMQLDDARAKEVQRAIVDRLIDQMLVTDAAKKMKIEDSEAFKQEMAMVKEGMLFKYAIQSKMEKAITDDAVTAHYKKIKNDYAMPAVSARHILVKEKGEAEDIIKKLNKGGKFDDLAKEFSVGPTGPNGGDLGWFTAGEMVKPFSDAAFALTKGEYTKEPVKTDFGWHIILLNDRDDTYTPSLADLEGEIRESLSQQVYKDFMAELKARAEIDYKMN